VKLHEYPHPAGIQSLALTADGQHVLTGGEDGRLRLFEAAGSEPLWIAEGLAAKPGFFVSAESPAHESIAAVSVGNDANKRVAVVVAIDSLRRPTSDGAGAEIEEEYVRLFELDFAKGDFREVSPGAGTEGDCLINLRKHGAVGWSAAIAADASRIVTVGRDEARLWGREGNELAGFRPHQDLTFAGYSPDGRFIVTASLDNSVRVWDASSGQARLTLDEHSAGPQHGGHRGPVTCAVFSSDDKYVFTGSEDGSVRKWDLETMRVVQEIKVQDSKGMVSGVTRIALSKDGQTLFTASRSGEAAAWGLADTNGPLRRLIGHSREILDLCLSPDENWLVTASADNTARLWDAASGAHVLTLTGHASEVTSVAILADGPFLRVLTGSSDKTAKLWAVTGLRDSPDAAERTNAEPAVQELLSLKGHTRELTSVAFAPDGRAALTTARDGLTILWPAIAPPAVAAPK
jgi:WD40 repeat protein